MDHDWDVLAVQTIPEMGIRSSIPDGVDYVMTINGEELAQETIERVFMGQQRAHADCTPTEDLCSDSDDQDMMRMPKKKVRD